MKQDILTAVLQNFDLLRTTALEMAQERGMGAIVFPREDADLGDHEFWDLAQIRQCLRQLYEYDEFIYRWLREVAQEDALPVGVFTRGDIPGTQELKFFKLTQTPAL